MIERRATDVALVTNRGFRDVLAIGRQKRYQLYDLQIEKPPPLLDRTQIFEVAERTLADGREHAPLHEGEARRTIEALRQSNTRSLAVCFLHSYANPAHERRFAELAGELAPEMEISLSCEVSPQFREYERTSTTVVDACLASAVRAYLDGLDGHLRDRGFGGHLFVVQLGGGIATAATMARLPVRMIEPARPPACWRRPGWGRSPART